MKVRTNGGVTRSAHHIACSSASCARSSRPSVRSARRSSARRRSSSLAASNWQVCNSSSTHRWQRPTLRDRGTDRYVATERARRPPRSTQAVYASARGGERLHRWSPALYHGPPHRRPAGATARRVRLTGGREALGVPRARGQWAWRSMFRVAHFNPSFFPAASSSIDSRIRLSRVSGRLAT